MLLLYLPPSNVKNVNLSCDVSMGLDLCGAREAAGAKAQPRKVTQILEI